MYIMIDNYDSFVHNLAVYFQELGQKIRIIRNDAVTVEAVQELAESGELEGIIISPGPKSPQDSLMPGVILKTMAGRIPILGVCLGHQIIGAVYGARVEKGVRPMHGKVTRIYHQQRALFRSLPVSYQVTRYHSLVISEQTLPDCLRVDAHSDDGTVMAISHRKLPVYGVQFHPEAVLTQYGHELLSNFIEICRRWRTDENHY